MQRDYPAGVDPNRAEVFSIGMTLLCAGILVNCQEVYIQKSRINEAKLNEYFNLLRNSYSAYLSEYIRTMVNINPQQRRSCTDMYNELRQYEDQILDLEPFNPPVARNPPQPVHQVYHYSGNQVNNPPL